MSGLEFEGIATGEGVPGGRAAGTISVKPQAILFQFGEDSVTLPFSGLRIRRGGANNALLFFSHDSVPDLSLYTRDKKILRLLHQQGGSTLAAELSIVDTGSRRAFIGVFTALLVILGGAWGAWLVKDPIIGAVANVIPISWEERAGGVIFSSIRADHKIIDDVELTSDLEKLFEPLVRVTAKSGYKFKFYIAEDDTLNAFAMPGGYIVVHSGVLLKAERLEEVLGVLAHELSHVTEKHVTKQVVSVIGIYVVFDFLLGNFFGTFAAISEGAPYLLQQGFSRAHERDADVRGLAYLREANVDPAGMVIFFERVMKEQESSELISTLEKSLNFLSTHPATEDRITFMKELIKREPGGPYTQFGPEFAQFQDKLRAKLKR